MVSKSIEAITNLVKMKDREFIKTLTKNLTNNNIQS